MSASAVIVVKLKPADICEAFCREHGISRYAADRCRESLQEWTKNSPRPGILHPRSSDPIPIYIMGEAIFKHEPQKSSKLETRASTEFTPATDLQVKSDSSDGKEGGINPPAPKAGRLSGNRDSPQRRKFACPTCQKQVIHLPRHLRNVHRVKKNEARYAVLEHGLRKKIIKKNPSEKKSKDYHTKRKCPVADCHAVVMRLSSHLLTYHKMSPSEQLERLGFCSKTGEKYKKRVIKRNIINNNNSQELESDSKPDFDNSQPENVENDPPPISTEQTSLSPDDLTSPMGEELDATTVSQHVLRFDQGDYEEEKKCHDEERNLDGEIQEQIQQGEATKKQEEYQGEKNKEPEKVHNKGDYQQDVDSSLSLSSHKYEPQESPNLETRAVMEFSSATDLQLLHSEADLDITTKDEPIGYDEDCCMDEQTTECGEVQSEHSEICVTGEDELTPSNTSLEAAVLPCLKISEPTERDLEPSRQSLETTPTMPEQSDLKLKQCGKCEYRASLKSELTRHIRTVHLDLKPYKCSLCDYRAWTWSYIEKHINAVHIRPKYFQCSYCDFSSLQKMDFKKHVLAVHSDQKPHKCSECDYKASTKGRIKRHILSVHSGLKLHECSECDFKTVLQSSMKRHISSVHTRLKPHKCPQCDYRASEPTSIKYHILAVHTRLNPHKCPQCDYRASEPTSIKKHVFAVHYGLKPPSVHNVTIGHQN